MRLSRSWAWAGLAAALGLGLGCASVPWSLDPKWLGARLNALAPMGADRWQEPSRATLRLFPTPVMDVYGLKLVDPSGKVAFAASTAAFGLSAPSLLFGNYVVVRARVKDPMAEIDLDALAPALPALLKSPPARMVQARGGRLRLSSRRLGFDEEFHLVNGSIASMGENLPLRATFGGVWRGQWLDLDAALSSPAGFLAGLESEGDLNVSTDAAMAKLHGNFQLGPKPRFAGSVTASVRSIAATAARLGFDGSKLASEAAEVSGRMTATSDILSLDEGSLGYGGETLEGAANLTRTAGAWSATGTLAAERLDLAGLLGPPPEVLTAGGEWSETAARIPLPPIDVDLRLSAARLVWGRVNFVDAALTLQRQADKATLTILEAEYGGGSLNGEIDVDTCATRCEVRASLTLANADLGAIARPWARNSFSGRVSGELRVAAFGAAPASLVETAKGELHFDATDGAIEGVNFEEALRRSQRRALDIARDLTVGRTAFRDFGAQLTIGDGVARIDSAELGGPGVSITAAGRVELSRRSWATTIEARQADAQGTPSTEGAALVLGLRGPWRSPKLSLRSHDD